MKTTETKSHKVTYTEHKPDLFDWRCIATCTCGWSEDIKGSWPSDARRLALVAGLEHAYGGKR